MSRQENLASKEERKQRPKKMVNSNVSSDAKESDSWQKKFAYPDAMRILGLFSQETADSYKQRALSQHHEQMAKSGCSMQKENSDGLVSTASKPIPHDSNKRPTGDSLEISRNM